MELIFFRSLITIGIGLGFIGVAFGATLIPIFGTCIAVALWVAVINSISTLNDTFNCLASSAELMTIEDYYCPYPLQKCWRHFHYSENGFTSNVVLSGVVSGLFQSSCSLGGFIGPLIGTILTEHIGFQWTSTCVAAVIVPVVSFFFVNLNVWNP